jgi:hypothetical protein
VSVGMCIPLSLLGNNSVKTFSRQRRIVGVVFYAVLIVSKESRLELLVVSVDLQCCIIFPV